MGTACSLGLKHSSIGLSGEDGHTKDDSSNKSKSASSAIVYCSLWNPFRISRDDAENLLQGSYAGAFIFSHSVTSEMFLSMSTGKYVCHHPILKQSQCYVIGGRDFNTIDEAVSFYRTSPLGEAILTEQYQSGQQAQSRTQTSNSALNSPPVRPQRTNGKRVTFNVPHSKSSIGSGPVSITVDNNGSPSVITGSTRSTGVSMDSKGGSMMDTEGDLNTEEEMIKKMLSTPRKSICRIQAEDSLSTSSGNMFKEEEF
ncbi:Hypothetical predicted protein [Paramuricea clavata]|uniref:Uncharacterized protein n=1 Tax=Paramuricea clavata TaxID=317549 RepID=A0A6S7KY93_PARCT|nr:Hypothetical predicted protein [Paramuricea clavata]